VLAIAILVAIVAGWTGTAVAHASLVSSQPAAGSLVTESPDQVVVRFDEAVGIPPEALRLFDSTGKLVAIGRPEHGDQGSSAISATVPELATGLYVVAWRAVSADTHPVAGAFTFQVGTGPTGADAGALIPKVLAEGGPHRSIGWLAGIGRFALIAGLVGLIGALAFPVVSGSGLDDRRWRGWTTIVAVAAALAGWLSLVFQVPLSAEGGPSAIVHGDAWSAFLQTTAGKANLVDAIALTVAGAAMVLQRNRSGWPGAAMAATVVAVAAAAASGHGASGRYEPLPFLLVAVHLTGAGVWLGGLAVLVLVTLDRAGAATVDDRTDVVGRFSAAAFAVVAAIVVTGVLEAWRQLGTFHALRSTHYGQLLLVKTGLVVAMLAVAALSRSVVSHRLSLRAVGAAPTVAEPRALLRRRVAAEVAIGVAVLGVTAALMASNPNPASASGPISQTLVDRDVIASVTVEPARVGPNGMHLYLSGPGGSLEKFGDVTASLSNEGRGVGPAPVPLQPAGPNHYIGTLSVPFGGTWTLKVTALVSEFDERVFTTELDIH